MRIQTVLLLTGILMVNLTAAPSVPSTEKLGKAEASGQVDVDVKPKLLKSVQPVYPYNQARAGVTGTVTVEFVITSDGSVQNPYVVRSNNPAFERPALDAVMKWKFSPGLKAGHPVNVLAAQQIEFQLDRGGREGGYWRISKGKSHASLPPQLQWDEAPVPVSTTFPVYPFAALQADTTGSTQVSFVVGPDGTVMSAKIMKATTPEMGLAALAMVETWIFTPAKKKDGTPAFAALSLEHDFAPSGEKDVPVTYSAQRILRLIAKQSDKIVGANELDQVPKPVSRRPPVYPLALRKTTETGKAVVEFFIDEEGDAQLPQIISSSAPEFGYSAVQAVASWRFEPPRKNGKTVITHARIPLEFKLSVPAVAQP